MKLYWRLVLGRDLRCSVYVGGVEARTSVLVEPIVRYHALYVAALTPKNRGTVLAGQFTWGGCLRKSNGGVQRLACYGWKPWLMYIRISQLNCETDTSSRVETRWKWSGISVWKGFRSTDKSYSGDNRLMGSKSPHRRSRLAPRCRLVASWGCRRSQGLGCSPIKAGRELGSERRETVRPLSAASVGNLRRSAPSTRGPEWTSL